MEKNHSKAAAISLHVSRRIIQVAALFLMPELFASTFAAFGQIVQMAVKGSFSWSSAVTPILLILATIPVTIIAGRFFCGFFCTFGAMGDFLWFVSRKLIRHKFRMPEKIDAVLKWVKYALLLFNIGLLWTGVMAFPAAASPWHVFGQYTAIGDWPGLKPLLSIGGLLLLGIIVGSLFVERMFCRYLCPMGAIYAILSKIRVFHIIKRREGCGSCRICTKKCSMGIPLYRHDTVTSVECINCFVCMESCPRSNVRADPKPVLGIILSLIAIPGLYYAGNAAGDTAKALIQANTAQSQSQDTGSGQSDAQNSGDSGSSTQSSTPKGKYKDGTYTGSGYGYRGTTKVQVTVKNGYITDIEVLSTQDDAEYFDNAYSTVSSEIIDSQDVEVDAVSGATFSSNGIKDAVSDALSQ